MELGCVIMAAGASMRFGSNKLLANWKEHPLYHYPLQAAAAADFSSVTVVTACPSIAETAQALGFQVVDNPHPELGVSRTIQLGLHSLSHCSGVMFMTADQPRLTSATLKTMMEVFRQQPDRIVAAAAGGKRGNPCVFPQALYPELLALTGDTGGSAVIRHHPNLLVTVEIPATELADADTPEALEELKRLVF